MERIARVLVNTDRCVSAVLHSMYTRLCLFSKGVGTMSVKFDVIRPVYGSPCMSVLTLFRAWVCYINKAQGAELSVCLKAKLYLVHMCRCDYAYTCCISYSYIGLIVNMKVL